MLIWKRAIAWRRRPTPARHVSPRPTSKPWVADRRVSATDIADTVRPIHGEWSDRASSGAAVPGGGPDSGIRSVSGQGTASV